MSNNLIVIEQSAWNELTGLIAMLSDKVECLIRDRRNSNALTAKEAAAYIGYSTQRLHELKGSKIPYSRNGSKVVFQLSDLDAFLAEHRINKRKD